MWSNCLDCHKSSLFKICIIIDMASFGRNFVLTKGVSEISMARIIPEIFLLYFFC